MRKSRFTESQIVGILKQGRRGPDRRDPAAAQHQQGDLLPLAGQVRRRLGRRAEAAAGAGGREREAQADVRRAGARKCGDQGYPEPKAVTPSAKREALAVLVQEHGLPVRRACQAVRLSRAAYYRPPRSRLVRDAVVVTALNEVVARHSRWGFWKCFYRLRRAGHRWNHKRVHRVYCALRLNLPRRTKRRVPARLRQPLVAPARLNEIWALDFMATAAASGRSTCSTRAIGRPSRSRSARRFRAPA
jgi:putative transposase